MIVSLKSAENTADSHCGRDAPFGRLRGARWLCHSSLCGAYHIASSFLASAPLAASELRGFDQSILNVGKNFGISGAMGLYFGELCVYYGQNGTGARHAAREAASEKSP